MPGRKPKGEPMTKDEMMDVLQQKRSTKLYKAQTQELADEAISKTVSDALDELKRAESKPKINLNDTEMVKTIVEAYIETCAANSSIPSMSGIALMLGYSRMGLYKYLERQETETSRYLQTVHDLLADILSKNALRKNTDNITAIFLLKAMFGFRDTQSVEFVNNTPNTSPTVDEITLRAGLLED